MQGSRTETIRPARNISGVLRLPGDKSISHRYAMLAAFAEGTSRIANYATGQDCASTLACMQALGANAEQRDGVLYITGCEGAFTAPGHPLDCGNSGSTMRMLSGLLAGQPHAFTLTGDASLSQRPMKRVAEPLSQMGARVELTDGHAPLKLHGTRDLKAIRYAPAVASAQVKSAVLFGGIQADGETVVEEKLRTRDHGELALRAFGAELSRTLTEVSVRGPQQLRAQELTVPGDISSATFFLAAALLFPEASLTLDGIGMNPTRAGILDVMVSLGLRVRVLALEEQHHELVGTLHVEGAPDGPLGAEIAGGIAAQLIDELPVLAAIAPYSRDGVRIRDAAELRVKESDRLALVARNLKAMGAEFTEYPDGLDVPGGQQLHGAEIETGGDHRIAMAFSIAALRADGESRIHDADCAAVSCPEFYELLHAVRED